MVVNGTRELKRREEIYQLLALSAQECWGLECLPQIVRAPGGKPYFPREAEREFNVSHSGELGLCALDRRPVGVDIQLVQTRRPDLPARVCSREELEWLERQPDRWVSFTLLWAMKESRAKYSGEGLTRPIRSIQVPLLQQGERGAVLDGLLFQTYQGEGWAAAVCGETPAPEQICWRKLGKTEILREE